MSYQTTTNQSVEELYTFTLDFFQFFGASVKKHGRKQISPLDVSLTSPLAESLGYHSLKLVFSPEDLGKSQNQPVTETLVESEHEPENDAQPTMRQNGVELIAQGSRIFDRMVEHLERRSALTMQRLPSRFSNPQELMAAIRPTNASIAKLDMKEKLLNLYVYNWHVTYRADDKFEEILTVAIDDNGNLYPLAGTVSDGNADTDLALPHLDTLLADGETVEAELDEEGNTKLPSLPPMTELTRLAETARKYAIFHADVRCVAHEVEVQQRLYRVLNRLNNYYTQQIEEVYDSHDESGEKRGTLEQDLRRKIQEEVENHRLRVHVRLFSYAIIQVPIAVADLTLTDGKQEVGAHIRQNQYSGTIQRPRCHACDEEITAIAIDRNGHITCDACIQQCSTCLDILCTACGVAPCSVCEKNNCDTCGEECWACGERACAEHASTCPVCRDMVCHACQTECAECGIRQCRSHLYADSVEIEDGHRLICRSCAVRCPGCEQYSARVNNCEMSGQRFCQNCLESCTECKKQVGPDYYIVNPNDKAIYCRDCITVCPACESPSAELTACQECEADCCVKCSATCDECSATLCADHTMRADGCGHVYCNAHAKRCAIGGEVVCAICEPVCGICERPHCTHHTESCGLCRCTYCTECMDKNIGLCNTCATIREDGKAIYLAHEPIAEHPDVAPLVHGYRWHMAQNLHYTIYLGEGPFNTGALVLVQNSADGPQPQPIKQPERPAGGASNAIDEIRRDVDGSGTKLRDALAESGLLDKDVPLQKFEKRRRKGSPPEQSADQDAAQTELGANVLVARKINALDLLWRRR